MASFYNRATLSYNGKSVNSNVTQGEITAVLTATKNAVTDSYTEGSEIVYIVNAVNSGAAPFTGVTLTDDLGAYEHDAGTLTPLEYVDGSVKVFVDGVLQNTPTVTAGPPLTVTGLDVPAGGALTVVYAARTNEYAPITEGGEITNTAVLSGTGIADLSASAVVNALTDPELTITKSVFPTTVAENGTVTYTFVIENHGVSPAGEDVGVTVTDLFDPALSGMNVTYNGTPWAAGTGYTYEEATGNFATVPGEITVPAATAAQDPATGAWSVEPGSAVITVTGTIQAV